MSSNNSIHNSNDYSAVVTGILLANLVLNSGQIFLSILNIFSLLRTSLIHPHLKAVLLTQSGSFCINSVGMSGFIITQETEIGKMLICLLGLNLCNFIGHALLIERIIATWKAHKYEKWRSPLFIVTLLISVVAIAFSVATFEMCKSANMLLVIFVFACVNSALCFSEIFAFVKISFHNKKRYKQTIGKTENGNGHDKLSERYQLNENIRTARQLAPVFLCHFFLVFGTVPLLAIQNFQLTTDTELINVLNYSYELYTTLFCTLIEFALLVRYPILRKNVVLVFRTVRWKVKGLICRNRIDNVENEICEKQRQRESELVAQFEMKRHFEILAKAWA
ncbi:hypothetical protein niasHT_026809 [Heterodera trifolii]|uniref:Gustatory receptor n=1 Tax=Heterodera trifolii TaxID=157864 RepID=A0ABD2JWH4_9BILA